MQPRSARDVAASTDGGRHSESGLLVLDDFLSFVDEVGDVVGPDASLPFPPASHIPNPIPEVLPEPIPLEASMTPMLYEEPEYYSAMPTEVDSSGSASPEPSSDTAAFSTTTTETTTLPVKKKRRRRQKEELDYLRVRVREMEDELNRLRGEAIASNAVAMGTAKMMQLLPPTTIDLLASGDEIDENQSDASGQEEHPVSQRQVWERVAQHQREETQKAVMENIRLRALLEGQLQVARSLETALRKKPRIATAELNPYIGKGSTIRLDGADEQAIYDSIGLQLDVLYAQVDAVLQSSGIRDVLTESAFKPEVRADEWGMFLEHKEVRVVPFDVHAVGRAVWKTLGRESMPLRNGVYIAREATDDTVCAKVVDTFRLPKAKSETVVTIRLVLKRFIEEDRVVSVWESLVETVGSVCLRLREKAWNVLRAHKVCGEQDEDGEPKPMCIAHSIIRVWPEMASHEMGENTEVGTLTNLVVGSYTRNLGIMAQIIQNLLSEEAKKIGEEGGDGSM